MDGASPELARVRAFVEGFRDHFPRADQIRWLSLYLWGLIATPGRKSIEAIARSLPANSYPVNSSPSQSLQHFVSRSPWDDAKLLRSARSRLECVGEADSTWVIHDAVFMKRGKHSVGVHRQYLRSRGIKVSSQTGVMISQVGPSGYLPLTIRLYLPRAWLESAGLPHLDGIPAESRVPLGKDQVALQLVDLLLAEGKLPKTIVVAQGYTSSHLLQDAFRDRKISIVQEEWPGLAAEQGREWLNDRLGLDHYEGRSWRGWHHHAAVVFLAHAFITNEFPKLSLPI